MKILHLLQSHRFSGAENVACQIIEMFRDREDIEFVYSSRDGQIRESLAERGIAFAPIKDLTLSEVKRVIKEQKPDIIHAHDRTACVYAALAAKNIPIVAHIHVNNNRGLASFVKNVVLTFFSNKYRHVFWVSDSAYEQFQFKSIVKNKSAVLYNVINIDALYEKADSDTALYDYDIVSVGRLSYQKYPERLLNVLHKVASKKTDVKIAIVGSGEYEQYVVDYIKNNRLENNISYLGYFNNSAKIIQSAKALVMTSRFEGTPMVVLEAQCLGVPVVSTPVDGVKKVIRDSYNGYLSDSNDELADRLVEIVSNENTHRTLSENSMKSARDYNDIGRYRTAIEKAYYGK